MSENQKLFALLIDGDNVQVPLVPQILNKISEYGKLIIKKVYLNKNSLEYWEASINEHSLNPVWVPNKTKGKNAADIALVIDAMELLCERPKVTGFCIVSSDSDFTQLAQYIVEKNKFVLGIGEDKTPISFDKACSKFLYIKDLLQFKISLEQGTNNSNQETDKENPIRTTPSFEILLIQAYENRVTEGDGWIPLIDVKEEMSSLDPEFKSSDYQNTRRLAEKVQALAESFPIGIIEVDEKLDSKPVIHHIRIDCDTFRFIEAYKQAPIREQGDWVLLTYIGQGLKKQSAYEDGFTYRGVKKSQLLKFVNEIVQAYPKFIKIRKKTNGKAMAHFVRIKE